MSGLREYKCKDEEKAMLSWMGLVTSYAAEIMLKTMKAKEIRKFKICDKFTTNLEKVQHNKRREKKVLCRLHRVTDDLCATIIQISQLNYKKYQHLHITS